MKHFLNFFFFDYKIFQLRRLIFKKKEEIKLFNNKK